jgi:signal transduction histidine kinase
MSALPLLYYGLYAMGQRHLPFMLLQWVMLIWPLLSLLLDFTLPRQDRRPLQRRPYLTRNQLMLYHGMMVTLIVFSFFPNMGLIRANDWVFNGYLLYYLLSAITMLALLQFRLARQNERRLQRRAALIEAETHREEQARWLALLNHELRTPLSTLNLVLSLPGQDNELQEDGRDAVWRISQLLERCQLADQLEVGRLTLRPEVVDLSDLLSGLMARCPAPQRLQLTGPSPGAITTDRQLLEIILGNLLDNAIKYAAPGTPIEIRIRPDSLGTARGIDISVHNLPGPVGWPDPSQLFRKYHRAPAAAGQPGSGLGLYLSQQLIRRLRGRLDYCPTISHVGFCLWLPRQDWS